MKNNKTLTFGVIVGTRGFFPGHLCKEGREGILAALKKQGIKPIIVSADLGPKFGAIENVEQARVCADLFKKNADKIDGIVVTLPNFGDERAIANAIRWSGLDVPVLVHAWSDDLSKMTKNDRRDSFCGKMSCCNVLTQYGIAYSLTTLHTCRPESQEFVEDLQRFAGVCRVTSGMKNLRLGVIGARPAPFATVRYSEKILEANGITIEPLDLSEVLFRANKLKDSDKAVKEKLEAIRGYTNCAGTKDDALLRMAKLGTVIDSWMAVNELSGSTIQCWTSLEDSYGIVPCMLMSMMSEQMLPSACETDVMGLISMYMLQLAAGKPSALLDWNNNYGDDPDKGIFFHCSNLPKSWMQDPAMSYQVIIADDVGKDNACGTMKGRIKPGPFTYLRLSSDDLNGEINGYAGEGVFTDDPVDTFGGYGVFEIPDLQDLLQYICSNGYEHHTAANLTSVSDIIDEAVSNYIGWELHVH